MTSEATDQADVVAMVNEHGATIVIARTHEAAIADLLAAVRYEETVAAAARQGADTLLATRPELAPYAAEVHAWASRVLGPDALRPFVVAMYAEVLSEADARGLAAFYRTPIGAKMNALLPTLSARGAAAGMAQAAAHQDELLDAIQARAAAEERPS